MNNETIKNREIIIETCCVSSVYSSIQCNYNFCLPEKKKIEFKVQPIGGGIHVPVLYVITYMSRNYKCVIMSAQNIGSLSLSAKLKEKS